jgi:hypothetical protein
MPRRTNTLRATPSGAPTWAKGPTACARSTPSSARSLTASSASPSSDVGNGPPVEPALVRCDAAQLVAERLGCGAQCEPRDRLPWKNRTAVRRRCPGTRARRSCGSAACSGSEPSPAVRSPIVYPRSFAAASRSASYFAVDTSTALRLLSASSGRRARARALASRVGVACPWNRGATWRANSS